MQGTLFHNEGRNWPLLKHIYPRMRRERDSPIHPAEKKMSSEGVESTAAKSSSGSEDGSKGKLPPADSSAPVQAEAVALSRKPRGRIRR